MVFAKWGLKVKYLFSAMALKVSKGYPLGIGQFCKSKSLEVPSS